MSAPVRDVARHDLVADELLELGDGNLERRVDLVGRLVLRRAVGVARAADVVHEPREPGVLDRHERHVGARDLAQVLGQVRRQVLRRARVEPRDERVGEGRDRFRRHHPLLPPGVDGREQLVARLRRMARPREQLGQPPALLLRAGRLGRPARRGHHAALVRHRLAAAEDLHREVPHRREAEAEPVEVGAAQAAERAAFRGQTVDRALHVDRRQERVDRRAVGLLRRHSTALAQLLRRRVRVRLGHRLVREPRVDDRPARAGGVHHVAAPERVDAEQGLGGQAPEAVHQAGFSFFMAPNQR